MKEDLKLSRCVGNLCLGGEVVVQRRRCDVHPLSTLAALAALTLQNA